MKYVEIVLDESKNDLMVFRSKLGRGDVIEINDAKISIWNGHEPGDATYEEITEAVNIYNERTKGDSNG
jgi:hypothetical protein